VLRIPIYLLWTRKYKATSAMPEDSRCFTTQSPQKYTLVHGDVPSETELACHIPHIDTGGTSITATPGLEHKLPHLSFSPTDSSSIQILQVLMKESVDIAKL
jgi:hypothetical protein